MYVSLAANTPDSTKSFLKVLLALVKSPDFNFGPNTRKAIEGWANEARPFVEHHGLVRPFSTVINSLSKGLDVADEKNWPKVVELFSRLKDKKPSFTKDTTITKEQLSLLNDVRLAVMGSDSAEKRLDKNAGVLHEPLLNKMYVITDTHTQADTYNSLYTNLQEHVRQHGKVSGSVMPETVLEKWREHAKKVGENLPQHQQYLDMRRHRRDIAQKAITNIIRNSGQTLLDVGTIRSELAHQGIQNDVPKWFVGKMDDKGNFYTSGGLKLLGKPLGEGRMNPKYNAETDEGYYCIYKAPFAQNETRISTEGLRSRGRVAKFGAVNEVLEDLDSYTNKWLPDLERGNTATLSGIAATVCEIIYQTSARISSVNAKTAGERTYGITTLTRSHVRLTQTSITITYQGKKAGEQKHQIKFDTPRTQALHKVLVECLANKKPDDYLFPFRGKPLRSDQLNTYLRELGFPHDFTIHVFRKLRGTAMAKKLMDKCPLTQKSTESEVNKWIEEQCKKVGKALGHHKGEEVTATTAIANYINPDVFLPVFQKTNKRPNNLIQKAIDLANKESGAAAWQPSSFEVGTTQTPASNAPARARGSRTAPDVTAPVRAPVRTPKVAPVTVSKELAATFKKVVVDPIHVFKYKGKQGWSNGNFMEFALPEGLLDHADSAKVSLREVTSDTIERVIPARLGESAKYSSTKGDTVTIRSASSRALIRKATYDYFTSRYENLSFAISGDVVQFREGRTVVGVAKSSKPD